MQVNHTNPCHGHYADPVAFRGSHGTVVALHRRLFNRPHRLFSTVATVSVQFAEADASQCQDVPEVVDVPVDSVMWRIRPSVP